MNKKLFLLSLLLICKICISQNLVPNGDFEQYSLCPWAQGQLTYATSWINPSVNTAAADYYNNCSPAGQLSVPESFLGYQQAHSGNGFAGFFLMQNFGDNTKEYLEVPLTSTLTGNTCYHFEMYVNLADSFKFTSDDVGVYFSDVAITGTPANLYPLPYTPQINNFAGNYPDTLNWTLISGDYTATGIENYLIIGNYKYDSLTTLIVGNNSGYWSSCYFFIDDVSLIECTTGLNDLNDVVKVDVSPNPFSDKLNVSSKGKEFTEFVLYDVTGKKTLQQSFKNSTSINTEQLAKGIYLYELRNKNGVIKKGKVVKE